MLTLIRGKSNKSKYMATLFRGVQNGVLVNITQNYFPCCGEHSFVVPYDFDYDLLGELRRVVDWAANKNNYSAIFIYANISLVDVRRVIDWYVDSKIGVDVFITVQDNAVQVGQIIIEEICEEEL